MADRLLPPERQADGGKRLLSCGLILIAFTLAGLAFHQRDAGDIGPNPRIHFFVAVLAVAACVYFAAVRAVLNAPPRRALPIVLLVALAMRLPVLAAPAFLSSDVNRYVWDGVVQQAGINPYRYVPADPALAALRDPVIYPDVNRAAYARTIYPPFAQTVFRAVAAIDPSVLAMRCAMLVAEAIGVLCMARLLALAGLPPARVLIYAWNPLAVWCFALDGHVDALSIGLLGIAFLARGLRRDGLAGAALGAAIGAKLLPALVAPALWRRWSWRLPLACAALLAAGYLYYGWIFQGGVGWRVLGFLPSYTQEEGLGQGTGLWPLAGLADLTALPAWAAPAYMGAAVLALAAVAAWCAFSLRPAAPAADIARMGRDAVLLASAGMLIITPHYAWYYVWLGLPACLYPSPAAIWLSAAALILYVNPLDGHFLYQCLLYVPALVLGVRQIIRGAPVQAARAASPVRS